MVTVVLPWRGGDGYREKARQLLTKWYTEAHPSYRLVWPTCAGPWCKAKAVMPVLHEAADDVVVVADADVWAYNLARAVSAVRCGVAQWAIPHRTVRRLSREATDQLYATGEPGQGLDREPYEGTRGGGVVVAHRDTLIEVPLDSRFKGWGQEDSSWGYALGTMLGEPYRGDDELLHMWHPPAERMTKIRGNPEGWKLYRRYVAALGREEPMQRLLEEGRCLQPTC
jgi:hypothetical protein